jgi:phenylacetate-CoA ligase
MSSINILYHLLQARRNQWLQTSDLEKLQTKKLRAIVRHAYENVPFYNNKFREAGIHPNDIRGVDDLPKIPFTTKQDLREFGTTTMLARGIDLRRCLVTETSGSTGIPTKVVYNQSANDFSKAINLRSHIENGLKVTSNWVIFGDPHHFPRHKWFQNFGIYSPYWVSVFDSVEKQIEILKNINPDVISGYSSSIRLLSQAIQEQGIKGIKPKVIIGTSEILDPYTRDYINSTFNIKMVDHFGCVELNRTAWECQEHSGYHIDCDAVVMEFINNNEHVSSGERGEIVYTGLYNYAMPLIRYRIGDIGVPSSEPCPCGRGFPMMKLIEGRSDAFMTVPSGRIFPPIIWTVIMRKIPGIGEFQSIQEHIDFIRVNIVPNKDFSERTNDQIIRDIKEVIGKEMQIEVNVVDEIPKDPSGKLRSAISKVNLDW